MKTTSSCCLVKRAVRVLLFIVARRLAYIKLHRVKRNDNEKLKLIFLTIDYNSIHDEAKVFLKERKHFNLLE